jgi:hypothetical protein
MKYTQLELKFIELEQKIVEICRFYEFIIKNKGNGSVIKKIKKVNKWFKDKTWK